MVNRKHFFCMLLSLAAFSLAHANEAEKFITKIPKGWVEVSYSKKGSSEKIVYLPGDVSISNYDARIDKHSDWSKQALSADPQKQIELTLEQNCSAYKLTEIESNNQPTSNHSRTFVALCGSLKADANTAHSNAYIEAIHTLKTESGRYTQKYTWVLDTFDIAMPPNYQDKVDNALEGFKHARACKLEDHKQCIGLDKIKVNIAEGFFVRASAPTKLKDQKSDIVRW